MKQIWKHYVDAVPSVLQAILKRQDQLGNELNMLKEQKESIGPTVLRKIATKSFIIIIYYCWFLSISKSCS